MKILSLFYLVIFLSCNAKIKDNATLSTINEKANATSIVMKGYQPIDPIQPEVIYSDKTGEFNYLDHLPNEATRVAIGQVAQNGSISYGPIGYARSGSSYSIIIDYIQYTTTSIPSKFQEDYNAKTLNDTVFIDSEIVLETDFGIVNRASKYSELKGNSKSKYESISNNIKIPVYYGIGLRIHASVTVLKDSINLGSLFELGFAASQKQLNGTLIIQTLGISGRNISQIIPIPDKINESTIQSSLQALATIKSKIYDDDTKITPQVVGFKLPYNIQGARDLIESTLQSAPPIVDVFQDGKFGIRQFDLGEREQLKTKQLSQK